MTAARVFRRSLAVLLLTILGAAATTVVVVAHERDSSARETLALARDDVARHLPAAQNRVDAGAQRLGAAAGLTEPTYSWTELTCTLDSWDAGLIVESYHQRCSVRHVELVADPSAKARVRAGRCTTVPVDRVGLSTMESWSVSRAPSRALVSDSMVPGCPQAVTGESAFADTVVLSGDRPDTVPPGMAWTVVMVTAQVSDLDPGCREPQLLTCDLPFDGSVLPRSAG